METGLKYLDRLASEAVEDESLLVELTDGYRRIGDVQGNAQNANLGDSQGALESYRRAIEVCSKGLQANPESVVLANRLSVLIEREGTILQQLGRTVEALKRFEEALSMLDTLATGTDEDGGIALSRWSSTNRIGDLHSREGRPRQALDYHTRAQGIIESLCQQTPESEHLQRFLAVNHLLVGKDHLQLKDSEGALDSYRKHEQIVSRLHRENPDSALHRRDVAYSNWTIARLLLELGRVDEALERNDNAMQHYLELANSAEDARAQRDLANAFQTQGMVLRAAQRPKEALEAYQRGLAIVTQLCEQDPQNDYGQRDVAIFHNKLGELYEEDLGQLEEAVQSYQQALQRHLMRAEVTDNPMYQRSIAIGHQNVGIVRRKQRRYQEALDEFVKSLNIRQRLREARPEDPTAADDLVYSLRITAWLLATCPEDQLRDGARAVQYAQQAVEIAQQESKLLCTTLAAAHAQAASFDEAQVWHAKPLR